MLQPCRTICAPTCIHLHRSLFHRGLVRACARQPRPAMHAHFVRLFLLSRSPVRRNLRNQSGNRVFNRSPRGQASMPSLQSQIQKPWMHSFFLLTNTSVESVLNLDAMVWSFLNSIEFGPRRNRKADPGSLNQVSHPGDAWRGGSLRRARGWP